MFEVILQLMPYIDYLLLTCLLTYLLLVRHQGTWPVYIFCSSKPWETFGDAGVSYKISSRPNQLCANKQAEINGNVC